MIKKDNQIICNYVVKVLEGREKTMTRYINLDVRLAGEGKIKYC